MSDRVEELALRIEWLEQALAGVPDSWARARLQRATQGLRDLHRAVARVHAHASDPRWSYLFDGDGALAAFLGRLFVWCGRTLRELEALAAKLRRGQPALAVFSFEAVSGSFAHFQRLEGAVRAAVADHRAAPGERAAWESFDADFEETLWAIEWLHMGLAARPGE